MESGTYYLPPEETVEEESASDSSLSDNEETGYVNYDNSASASSTPRSACSKDFDYDIAEIRVEIKRADTPPLLTGTVFSHMPHPPSHPRRSPCSPVPSLDLPYTGPYFEERGEVSGHFEQDDLSLDLVCKPPSGFTSGRLSTRVTFHDTSSHDSGVSSQATSRQTPASSLGSATHHDTDSLDSYSSRISSQLLEDHRSGKRAGRSSEDDRLPGTSTLDSLENMSDNLADFGVYQNSPLPNCSSKNSGPTTRQRSGHKLTSKAFHRSYYIRARYPTQLHIDKYAKVKQNSRLPSCLCPPSRYGKEPRSVVTKPKRKPLKRWPEAPRYPPKARHASTECEILRLVETLDLGVQCSAVQQDASVQCVARMADTATQYPRQRVKTLATQTVSKQQCSIAIQNTPTMRSRMVETSTRILYFPEINTAHAGVQCGDSKILNHSAPVKPKLPLTRQDTIEMEKQINRELAEKEKTIQIEDSGTDTEPDSSDISDSYSSDFSSGSEDAPPSSCEKHL